MMMTIIIPILKTKCMTLINGVVFDSDALVICECQHIRHLQAKLKTCKKIQIFWHVTPC